MGIPPFRLVRRLGLSCRRASRVVSSDEWEASKTAGASRLVSVSSLRPVIHAAGGSSPGASWCSRRVRHRLAISSPASKQAAAAGRSRGVGRGLFFQAVGSDGGVMPSHRAAFPRSAGAAMIPGAGVMPSSFSRRSPIRASPHIHHHIEKTTRQASRREEQNGLGDRIPAGNGGQANKTRTANDLAPSPLSSHGPRWPTSSISYRHQHNRPAHPTSTQRDARRDAGTTGTTERTTNGRTRRKRTSLARRQASNETHDETTNETMGETETTRKKASSMGEGMRTRRTKRPHFLTSRPTPPRLFSLICRPQLFPRPRAWDEQR